MGGLAILHPLSSAESRAPTAAHSIGFATWWGTVFALVMHRRALELLVWAFEHTCAGVGGGGGL
jgi:hypothetical protein